MHRYSQEGGLQLVDGMLSGKHLRDESLLGPCQGPGPDRRNHARADDR